MLLCALVCFVVGYVSGSDIERVAEGSRPFQVSLRLHDVVHNSNEHFCSGAILDSKWVVTAGRCLLYKKKHRIRVVAGTITISSGGSWHEVDNVIIHENFMDGKVANDIGLLKIKGQIGFNDKISSISLPKSKTPIGSICVVSGWGFANRKGEFPGGLRAANETTVPAKKCLDFASTICASMEDGWGICMTKAGSPLTKDNELVGLGSFDIPCSVRLPNFYVEVFNYKGWIASHMK